MKKIIISILAIICIVGGVLGYIVSHRSMELPRIIEDTFHTILPSQDNDIIFEFRVPKTTKYESTILFECVTNTTLAPVFMEKAQVRTIGEYLIFSGDKTDACIIPKTDTKIAGIISQKGLFSQVFVLPANNISPGDWTEWTKPTYIDSTENAASAFAYNTTENHDNQTSVIPTDSFEMRYKVSKHIFPSDSQYAEMTLQQKNEKKQNIQDIRNTISAGHMEGACIVATNDPRLTLNDFLLCKNLINSKNPGNDRWLKISLFFDREKGGFKGWYNDEISGVSIDKRDLTKIYIPIPESEQAWFVGTFLETWLSLDDAQILSTSFDVRNALQYMQKPSQTWSPASLHVLDQPLKERMIQRILQANPQVMTSQDQSKLLIDFLQGKDI